MNHGKRGCLLALFAGWALLALAASVGAGPHRDPSQRGKGITPQKRREIVGRLNLTDSQRLAFKQRRAAFRKRMVELRNGLALKKVERDNELEKATPDKARVNRLTDEIGALRGQMAQEDNNHRVEFEKSLTPEQLEKWRVVLKERAASPGELENDD